MFVTSILHQVSNNLSVIVISIGLLIHRFDTATIIQAYLAILPSLGSKERYLPAL